MKRIAIAVLIIVLLFVQLYIDNCTFGVTTYQFTDSDSNLSIQYLNGKTIVHISDLHDELYGDESRDLISQIDALNPDYIFLTGDMISANTRSFKGFYSLCEYIGAKYDCYYVWGNHEDAYDELRSMDKVTKTIESYGIHFINNEKVELDDNIVLYGFCYDVFCDLYDYKETTIDEMNKILGKPDESKLNILLAHRPEEFVTYSDWGADIVFSGHNHGGLVRIFGHGLLSASRGILPKYDSGVFAMYDDSLSTYNNPTAIDLLSSKKDSSIKYNDASNVQMENLKSVLILSRGLSRGTSGFRLFNQPEVVCVKFN